MNSKPFRILLFTLLLMPFAALAQEKIAPALLPKRVIPQLPDTIYLETGTPLIILASIPTKNEDQYDEDRTPQEAAELKRHFAQNNRVQIIESKTVLQFPNQQTVALNIEEQAYNSVIFWKGRLKDDVMIQAGLLNATEFVAKELNADMVSSYNAMAAEFETEKANIMAGNQLTAKSALVQTAFLRQYLTLGLKIFEDGGIQYLHGNIKTANAALKEDGKTRRLQSLEFDKDQKLKNITMYNREGKLASTIFFTYQAGALTKIIRPYQDTTRVYIQDNRLYLSNNRKASLEKYWLEDNRLLKKEYNIQTSKSNYYKNSISQKKLAHGCVVQYLNDEILFKDCPGVDGVFPYENIMTSYQDGTVMYYRKTRIVQLKNDVFQKFYSDSENQSAPKIFGTYYLNNRGLIEHFDFVKDGEQKKLMVEYTYFD